MTAERRRRVLLVGAGGVIGRAVHALLAESFDIIPAGLEGDGIVMDLADPVALCSGLERAGRVHHVVSAAGRAAFVPLAAVAPATVTESAYALGLADKLMGQVNLALAARDWLEPGGSVVLTSGTTDREPIAGGSSLSMVNGALSAWVQAAATEFPPGLRLNLVSPGLVAESPPPAHRAFAGFLPVPAATVALAYLRCLQGGFTGRTLIT
jgi:NAD(P)-dependent dehydrogenase (short-subunit alcohol dehydrogenase family)